MNVEVHPLGRAALWAVLGLAALAGCRVPAQPPGGFVVQAPPSSEGSQPTDASETVGSNGEQQAAVDPFAVDQTEAEAEAEARAAIEDPAACLRTFTRANGFGDDEVALRILQSACDRAGLDARACDPQSWLTRQAAECLARTRAMEEGAEIEAQLVVDGQRGRMIWSVTGELNSARFRRTWEVELDAQTGSMVGIRQQHQAGGEIELSSP